MEKVTPERIVSILKKYNETVTLDEAKLIIEFMRMLANIEIEKIMNHEDSGPLCEGEHG